jgi:hypothetical protein
MLLATDKLPSTGGKDLLPGLPSSLAVENYLMNILGILQKYGVLVTIMCCIMFIFFYKLSKIRKNMVFAKFWILSSWGMVILTIIFILLPYIVLGFYEASANSTN